MSLFFYAATVISFVIFSYTFGNANIPNIPFIRVDQNADSLYISLCYIALVFSLIGWYLYFLHYFSVKSDRRYFYKVIGISSLLLFSFPGMLSYDIFNYIATARIVFLYGENPYVIMPIEMLGDSMLPFMHAANKTALYGPVWIVMTAIPHFLSFQHFILSLVTLKLFIGGFYLLTTLLLYKMTKSIYKTALFSLSPLVIMETFVSAHNDIVMVFFMLCCFYLLRQKKIVFALACLVLSVLIKFATLFLVPVIAYIVFCHLTKRRVPWEKVYLVSLVSMFIIFLLSFLREEIYPWYGLWFFAFVPLINLSKILKIIILTFSFSLLFRYVPYILLLTHIGITPMLKWGITFIPSFLVILYLLVMRTWSKK